MELNPEHLVDRSVTSTGHLLELIEQPLPECPCLGTGWLGGEWLWKREPECNCEANSQDFLTKLHSLECDSVPCPFCMLEGPYADAE